MFKDYHKYLSTSLKVYLFVLTIIVILKLIGLDYFGIDINNPIYLKFNNFILDHKLENVYYFITLYIYTYMFISISNHDNSKKAYIFSFFVTIVSTIIKFADAHIGNSLVIFLIDFFYLIFMCELYSRFKNFKIVLKRSIKLLILNTLFQLVSLYLRNVNYYNNNATFVINSILDFDYILMLLIYYKVNFIEGGVKLCGTEVILSLQKKLNLKTLQRKLQKNLHKFKLLDKETKLTYIIYFMLSLIWNILSVIVVLYVAKLNHTFIECIFILTSFWLSKKVFGKPFHLPSMVQCFIVSNLTYYFLNRLTTPLGISILVPIMLGVGLSYVTSKLVKKLYKPLYRGMPKEMFEETILKVTDRDSIKYKICYDYYIEKKRAINVALKYCYSEAGIRKILDNVNKKIKGLNK